MKGTFLPGILSLMSLSPRVLLIGRRGNIKKRQGPLMWLYQVSIYKNLPLTLSPLLSNWWSFDPLWSMKPHREVRVALLLLLGYSVGVDETHSELLTLSPRQGRNIVYNCEAGVPAKQRQYVVRYKKLEASCFCNISSWKRNQSHTFRLCLGSTEACEL